MAMQEQSNLHLFERPAQLTNLCSQEISDYLDGLSDGSILAIGVKDSASGSVIPEPLNITDCNSTANLNEIGIAALQKLGSFEISRLQYRESFAMIAVKVVTKRRRVLIVE